MNDERPWSSETLAEAVALYESELGKAYETWRQGDRRAAAEAAVLAARSLAARLGFGVAATPLTMLAGGLSDLPNGKALDWLKPSREAGTNNTSHKQDKHVQAVAILVMQALWRRTKDKAEAERKVAAAMISAGYRLGGRRELSANTIDGWYERRHTYLAGEEDIWNGRVLEENTQQSGRELSSEELLGLLHSAVRNTHKQNS
jgi:hypothetical protein